MSKLSKLWKLINNNSSIIGLVILSIFSYIVSNGMGVSLELTLMISVGGVSLILLSHFIYNSRKDNTVYLVGLLMSITMFFHLLSLDKHTQEFNEPYIIEENSDYYVFKYNDLTLYSDKSDIIHDSINPLKVYKTTNKDIFGYILLNRLSLKSDLMDSPVRLNLYKNIQHRK